jgi:phospho-N-acetylmuramoyl-pentapeptide-transferase
MNTFYVVRLFSLSTISFVCALLWTPLLSRILYRYRIGKGIRDAGSAPIFASLHRKKSGVPTMGGVLVWGTTLVLILIIAYLALFFDGFFGQLNILSRAETLLPLGALVASALVGMVDDLFDVWRLGHKGGGLRMRHRFFVYAGIAVIGAWWFYFKLGWSALHVPFVGNIEIGWWYIPFFVLVIVATAFSVNETDGLDGLAGGTLLMAYGAYGAIAFAQGKYDLATLCGIIMGALLAFLWFNIHPARFFMGDTGSMSLGVTLGIIAMLTNSALLLPVIGFGFMIESLSVLLQLASKRLRGKKIFLSSPLHHHLEAIGWTEAKIVMRFWVVGGVAAVVGLSIFLVDRGW